MSDPANLKPKYGKGNGVAQCRACWRNANRRYKQSAKGQRAQWYAKQRFDAAARLAALEEIRA